MVSSNSSQQAGALVHVTKVKTGSKSRNPLLSHDKAAAPPRPSEQGNSALYISHQEPLSAWRAATMKLQIPATHSASHRVGAQCVLARRSQVDLKACVGWGRLQSPTGR